MNFFQSSEHLTTSVAIESVVDNVGDGGVGSDGVGGQQQAAFAGPVQVLARISEQRTAKLLRWRWV